MNEKRRPLSNKLEDMGGKASVTHIIVDTLRNWRRHSKVRTGNKPRDLEKKLDNTTRESKAPEKNLKATKDELNLKIRFPI